MTIQVITENTTVQNATPDEQFTGVDDARMAQTDPTTTMANWDLKASKYGTGDAEHSLIKAILSNIPASATINSARIYLWQLYANAGTRTITAYPLLRNWIHTESTYNVYSTGNIWTTAGCNDATDRSTSNTGSGSIVGGDGVWRYVDVTAFVQAVVNGTITNYGVKLERTDGSNDATYNDFADSEGGADGQRPEWVIDYTAAGGGDPEGQLIGGKLLGGGLLLNGGVQIGRSW